jgi:cellulose synthase/poly-beta-1,6-N-acetylglucosamine synthase-like glycosyltransferase
MKEMVQTQEFFNGRDKANVSYLLAMNNFKMIHENIHMRREIDKLLKKEYDRLSREHDFNLPEQPFCIMIPTINNGQDFRYEYNLQSIYNQNYTNYKIVIIDDASKDSTFELIQQFIE